MGKNTNQKTLVVSDLHLTPVFDKKKFDYLKGLFQKADRLIVNGDLWSYYYCDFADFLESGWSKLFPIMLAKKCVYIHGNHDREKWCREGTKLFSVENYNVYSFKQNGKTYHLEHGYQMFHNTIQNEKWISFIKKHQVDKYNYAIQELIVKKLGNKFYSKIGAHYNKSHKKYIRKTVPKGEFLICGHTHSPEVSTEKRYLNSGFINYGFSSYLIIEDTVSLIQERY